MAVTAYLLRIAARGAGEGEPDAAVASGGRKELAKLLEARNVRDVAASAAGTRGLTRGGAGVRKRRLSHAWRRAPS